MKNETRRIDQVLMYLVFVFVLLLAFSLGVFAGKEFSDREYDLITLNSSEYSPEKFATNIRHSERDVAAAPAIEEDKIAELAQQALIDAEKELAQATAETRSEPREVASIKESDRPTQALERATERVASDLPPSATKPVDPRQPTRLPDAVGTAQVAFTVQVASYPSQEEAMKHANNLVQKGFPAFQVPAEVRGQTWYRVSVGSFKSSQEASSFRSEFLTKSGEKTAIVQQIAR